jgi:hypothetical protein
MYGSSMTVMDRNIGDLFMYLQSKSVWDADRARRLFDSGCPKLRVKELCLIEKEEDRDAAILEEEKKFFLEPLVNHGFY